MEIEITVYKESGKWYTSKIIKVDKEIPIYERNDFKQFIRENIPAKIGEGFIVTKDVGDGFHNVLWKYSEIYR